MNQTRIRPLLETTGSWSSSHPERLRQGTHLSGQRPHRRPTGTPEPSKLLQRAQQEVESSLELDWAAPGGTNNMAQIWGQIKDLPSHPQQSLINREMNKSLKVPSLTLRSSHSMSSLGLFHSFSRSAYFFFSSFSFSRSCESSYKHHESMIHTFIKI